MKGIFGVKSRLNIFLKFILRFEYVQFHIPREVFIAYSITGYIQFCLMCKLKLPTSIENPSCGHHPHFVRLSQRRCARGAQLGAACELSPSPPVLYPSI